MKEELRNRINNFAQIIPKLITVAFPSQPRQLPKTWLFKHKHNTLFTFLTAVRSLFTTMESAIIKTRVTADNSDRAARTIPLLSVEFGTPSSKESPAELVRLKIVCPDFFASSQASRISSATSSFSSAICSPTLTKRSTAYATTFPISWIAFRALSERRPCSLWLTSVVICKFKR